MTQSRYGLRARVMTLTLAPTLIVGLLISLLFSVHRYHALEQQIIDAGTNIIEPLAIASEEAVRHQSRESVRQIISHAHRKYSKLVRSIAVFDARHELFVTSNFHPNFDKLAYPKENPVPMLSSPQLSHESLILRTPIVAESRPLDSSSAPILGYIAIELDLSALRLQQYQDVLTACLVLLVGLGLSAVFALRLMHDLTRPITHMKNMVDRIRRGHLDVRIEGTMHGELDALKKGINAMAVSLSEYHVEMQHSIDQATSDLRETLEQLEIQNIELDIAKKRAQEAARVKSEFLANMSHELRTPLNGVIGFTRQMLKTQLTHSQKDYLHTIEKSANNLLTIINDILDFSKLEADKLTLEHIPFTLREALEEVVILQATSAHEKGLEITLTIDPKVPIGFVGDPLRIQQILTNLVGNAIKFTERGNIDISVELRTQLASKVELQFTVRDTGIGISDRQKSQLFQAFRQADASISRRYGGTGLGLVITQKLVKQMDGEISLTSRLHQGSTFWFILPLTPTDIPMPDSINASLWQQQSLLLVEQNTQAAQSLQLALIQKGIQITHCTQLPEIASAFDAVILSLPVNQDCSLSQVKQQVESALPFSSQIFVGIASTQLALAEQLSAQTHVICLTKPLFADKLLSLLTKHSVAPNLPRLPNTTMLKAPLPLSVMAVDDNPANLTLITALLEETVTQVTACSGGNEAIQAAQQNHFDVILMDIQMPQIDGVAACQAIKQFEHHKHTPIIAVTAHAVEGERERLLTLGMDDYLTKPIDETRLQQLLLYWSKPSQIEQPPLAPMRLNENTNTALPSTTLAVIDWELACQQAANKVPLAKELLEMLVQSLPQVQSILTQSLNDPDYPLADLRHHIHKLHGSCVYCGVPRLTKLLAHLEHHLNNEVMIKDVEPELLELNDEIELVLTQAPAYLTV